ncbi:MAG: hypothetical protein GC159_12530 [Phycisphaera sp.]|nr:hypothetical protein [Phycisphaera sp.]
MARTFPTLIVLALFAATPAAPARAAEPTRISLTPDMLINLSGQRTPIELIDEQDAVGDARGKDAAKPKTIYTNGWINRDLHYPMSIVIDLGVAHDLSDICYYDADGDGTLTVDAGPPAAYKTLFTDPLKRYNTWVRREVKVTTRYVRLTFDHPQAKLGEIVLYGTATGPRPDPPKPQPRPRSTHPTMDVFIGLNGFNDDPVDKLAAGGQVREYHSWIWDEGNESKGSPGYPNSQFAWSPSWVRGKGWAWDFDAFYRKLHDAGVLAAPVMQGSPPWMKNHDAKRIQEKPVDGKEDPTDPKSYIEHADYLFQFVARYGGRKVDDALLKLEPGQPRVSGLGLVGLVEGWNEPDRTWGGRAEHFTPIELAAMCSADYDGHRGALGKTVGVKNADPDTLYVLPGLAFADLRYLRAMKYWADVYRGGDFPADVINVHHYCNDADGQAGKATIGVSPEANDLKGRMRRIAAWRDVNAPGRELWLSEFGYDTNPGSIFRAPAIGPNDAEEVQGQWLVRSYLELAAAGVDRAQMFMLRDPNAASPDKFASSGLTSEKKTGHKPKKSWYFVIATRRCLTGARFDAEVDTGRDDVRVYRFVADDRVVYAVWRPTSDAGSVPDYVTPITVADGRKATLTELTNGKADGVSRDAEVHGGRVTLTVTERPVFITVTK